MSSSDASGTALQQMQHLRDVRDLSDQILSRLDRLDHHAPLSAKLIRLKWGLQGLPQDLDEYVDRLERVTAGSASVGDEELVQQIDLAQLTRDLLEFAAWLDQLEDVRDMDRISGP
ncbi:hypothetical protein [Streptomyces sp. NPDC017991]|uniref:hypothetical protein n=1 Tax=Streptomyces sp. NPDC017991 TaxID=3365026 RepID=UPI003793EE73